MLVGPDIARFMATSGEIMMKAGAAAQPQSSRRSEQTQTR